MSFREKHERSVAKAITYRVLIIASNSLAVYLFTHDSTLTGELAVVSAIVGTIIYYLHERVWNRIHWGKSKR